MAFRREKFVPRGGPSGGDGGRGGDVILEASQRHHTLVHFRFNPEHKAERGRHGEGSNCSGREGDDIVLKVPVGTVVYDDATGDLIHDFQRPDERIVLAHGGRGGRGNQHFATSTPSGAPRARTWPRRRGEGCPAGVEATRRRWTRWSSECREIYPDRSHFIGASQDCRLSVHNTGTQPGCRHCRRVATGRKLRCCRRSGLIEGAHLGAGLGAQFLRHIERTRLLAHIVDVSDGSGRLDPTKDYQVIEAELKSFGHGLDEKPRVVVASKCDVANPEKLKKLRAMASRKKLDFYAISAVTGEGIDALKYALAERVRDLRAAFPEAG